MSVSSDLQIESAVKTVTAAGTREPLAAGDTARVRVRAVTIRGLSTNTGYVWVGDNRVVAATPAFGYCLAPGEAVSYSVDMEEWKAGLAINLAKIYVDVDVNGEGVCYTIVRD